MWNPFKKRTTVVIHQHNWQLQNILTKETSNIMAFNLANFQKLLGVAVTAASQTANIVSEWGSGDHINAVQTAVATAGAFAQSATSNPQTQQEAAAAAQVANALVPIFFEFGSMFKNAASTPVQQTGTNTISSPAQVSVQVGK